MRSSFKLFEDFLKKEPPKKPLLLLLPFCRWLDIVVLKNLPIKAAVLMTAFPCGAMVL